MYLGHFLGPVETNFGKRLLGGAVRFMSFSFGRQRSLRLPQEVQVLQWLANLHLVKVQHLTVSNTLAVTPPLRRLVHVSVYAPYFSGTGLGGSRYVV